MSLRDLAFIAIGMNVGLFLAMIAVCFGLGLAWMRRSKEVTNDIMETVVVVAKELMNERHR